MLGFLYSPKQVNSEVINDYDKLPIEVQIILDTFDEMKCSYKECARITDDLEQIGWTCEYGLEGEPYDFKRI